MNQAMPHKISPIIKAQDLLVLKQTQDFVLIDARAGVNAHLRYTVSHLSGALHVDLDRQLADVKPNAAEGGRHPLPSVAQFIQVLTELGITPLSKIIIYDDKNCANAAARFWWMLKSIGHAFVQVLDGGFDAAIKAGYPLAKCEGQEAMSNEQEAKSKRQRAKVEGQEAKGEGQEAKVEGQEAKVEGQEAKVEGQEAKVEGQEAKVEGQEAKVEGQEAKVEGQEAKVEGQEAKVEGQEAKVEGQEAKVEGQEAIVEGQEAIVEGQEAIGVYQIDEWLLPVVDISDVEKATHDARCLIIDVREAGRYNGEFEPIDLIAGHIPNAINIPYISNLDTEGCFLSPSELREKYKEALTDRQSSEVTIHCGSGVTACHTLLAMDYAGMDIPKLYVGSWSEWSRNETVIVTRPSVR
jgi:3-mercaptopyruvate sulfurtransferase SseA